MFINCFCFHCIILWQILYFHTPLWVSLITILLITCHRSQFVTCFFSRIFFLLQFFQNFFSSYVQLLKLELLALTCFPFYIRQKKNLKVCMFLCKLRWIPLNYLKTSLMSELTFFSSSSYFVWGILVIVQIFDFRFLAHLHILGSGESKNHKISMVSECWLVSLLDS